MTDDRARRLQRLRTIARLMDTAVRIPGTQWRVGLDGVLGLVPGLGDGAGLLVSGYFLVEAWRLGVSRLTLVRMVANVGLDALVGTVPVVGDFFDVGFKANQRNLRLLERELGIVQEAH